MSVSVWNEEVFTLVHVIQPDWTQLPVDVWATIIDLTTAGIQRNHCRGSTQAVKVPEDSTCLQQAEKRLLQ